MQFTLLEKKNEAKDTVSFFWKSEQKIDFMPGQYFYYTLKNLPFEDARGGTRQFTIASSPTEENYRLTTRLRQESAFKSALNSLKIGDEIEAEGPSGSYILDENLKGSQVLFAGGIGVTPFRSFIKYCIDQKLEIPIFLIYSNSDDEFVFKNEFEAWQKDNSFLNIYYHNSGKNGHLDEKKLKVIFNKQSLDYKSTNSWIVGPPAFVSAIENILEGLNVNEDKIHTEKFIGY